MAKPRYRWIPELSPDTAVDAQGNPAPEWWYRQRAMKHATKYLGWSPSLQIKRLIQFETLRVNHSWEAAIVVIAKAERPEFGTDLADPDEDERHRAAIERSLTHGRNKLTK